MTSDDIRLRRLAEGFALDAFPKWQRHGIRIANYAFRHDGVHHEWLTIIGRDGGLRIWQHHPVAKAIGTFSAEALKRLAAPVARGFGRGAIRGHLRAETRRRR